MARKGSNGWRKLSKQGKREVLNLAPPGGFVTTRGIRDRAKALESSGKKDLADELKSFAKKNAASF
jgi:hypothetical protein